MRETMNIREAHCVHCGDTFACRRITAKFCSNACKMDYHRRGSKMKQAHAHANFGIVSMVSLIQDSEFWKSPETLEMIEQLEKRLRVLKERAK